MKDLVILVADIQQEKTIQTLLDERRSALGVESVTFDIFRHSGHDPGVYPKLVRSWRRSPTSIAMRWCCLTLLGRVALATQWRSNRPS